MTSERMSAEIKWGHNFKLKSLLEDIRLVRMKDFMTAQSSEKDTVLRYEESNESDLKVVQSLQRVLPGIPNTLFF